VNRIDELIAELAPRGVEFKPVGEVTAKSSNIKWANAGDDEFQYIDLSSVDRVTRRIGETAAITAGNAPSRAQQIVHTGDVIFATTRPAQMRWAVIPAEYDGQIASTGYCVLRPDTSVVLTNFLAHVLGTDVFRQYVEANQVAGNYPSIPDNRVRAYRIPVPPLEVQREIVRILDQFTQLEAELEAELKARRRQYEHYRSELFDYSSENVAFKAFADVGTFSRGGGPQKKDFVESGVGCIHYGQIYTHYGVSASVTNKFVDQAVAIKSRCADSGDVIIAVTSENDDDLARSVAWLGEGSVAVSNHTLIFKSEMDPRFVSHFLRTRQFDAAKRKHISGTKVKSLALRAFEDIGIPVPPMQEQRRLADTLDKFDALVNDLSVGLPAELNARRKQYEYYRDRLLTFKELAA
jgi:type I restriction enzyme S subunit